MWRDVEVLVGDSKAVRFEPAGGFVARGCRWQYPESSARSTDSGQGEQPLQISKTGNAGELLTAQQSPEQDHQPTVRDRHVRCGECDAELGIAAHFHHPRRRGHYDVAMRLLEMLDRCVDRAVEEPDAEDLLETSRNGRAHEGNVQRPTSNAQRFSFLAFQFFSQGAGRRSFAASPGFPAPL